MRPSVPEKWQFSRLTNGAAMRDACVPLTYIRNFIRSRVESVMRALHFLFVSGQSGEMIKHFAPCRDGNLAVCAGASHARRHPFYITR